MRFAFSTSPAGGYLHQVAQAAFGAGSRKAAVWLDKWLPALKTTTPETVLEAIRGLPMPNPQAVATRTRVLAYVRHRIDLLRYARFQQLGYPIGSGMVERGNKLVVEARLKGAGMHWGRANVTPMVALREVLCSGWWQDAWPRIWQRPVRQVAERGRAGRRQRQAARAAHAAPAPTTQPALIKRLSPEPKPAVTACLGRY